jgi:hypothetical protein
LATSGAAQRTVLTAASDRIMRFIGTPFFVRGVNPSMGAIERPRR